MKEHKVEDYLGYIERSFHFKKGITREEIRDLVQDVVEKTYQYPYNGNYLYTTYLSNMVNYTYLNYIRKNKNRGMSGTEPNQSLSVSEWTTELHEEAEEIDLFDRVMCEKELQLLSNYPLLIKYYVEEKTLKEIGKELNLSYERVRQLINKSKGLLVEECLAQ